MTSPKDSSRHSLVTYNSDISDEERHEPIDTFNDASDLMSISPATIESSVGHSNEVSPKEKTVEEEITKKKFKKPLSSNSLRGLVSYDMDDDDDESNTDDEDEEIEEANNSPEKENSISREDNTQNMPIFDNEEFFNNDDRESDNDMESNKHDKPDNDLKSHSGISSSRVKAHVITERPKGNDLAYLLSRQIYNSGIVSLPTLPTTKPSVELEMKISDLRVKAQTSRNPTETILKNKAYRNPSIYEKLIQHMKIDERGTNYPPELYDPYRFGEESYYEVLAKNQDSAERKRLEHEANGSNSKTTKTSVIKPDLKARKTKWDTGSRPAISKSSTSGINIETKTMYPLHK